MTRSESVSTPPWWVLAPAGVALGVLCLPLAAMPGRWVAAAVAGAFLLVATLAAGRPRRAALVLFVFSLQLGLALYLTEPPSRGSYGASWPDALALPLASLTALAALATAGLRRTVWSRSFAAGVGLLVLTTVAAIPGSPVRLIGLAHVVMLGAYLLILLAAANSVRDAGDLELVIGVLMATLVLQSLVYFVQSLAGATFTPSGEWIEQSDSGPGRYGGTVGTRPAAFSSFLLPLVLVALARLLTSTEPGVWWRYGAPAVLGSAALILTYTRASWGALLLGLAYLAAAAARRRLLVRARAWMLLAALTVLLAALSPWILRRASDDHRAALDERRALIEMALRVIRAHPWTGVGPGAYPFAFRDYLTPELADRWLFVVHNVYVLRAAETGLPGLAALLLFLWASFRIAGPDRMVNPAARSLALGWRAGLLALASEMLWDVSLGPAATGLLWFLCGLMPAAARIGLRLKESS